MEYRGKSIPTFIYLQENKDCKTDKIHLLGEGCKKIGFSCTSFENLKEIIIEIENPIRSISLPIFYNHPIRKYDSLINFTFFAKNYSKDYEINSSVIKNIYNNIDNMPKLQIFKLKCYSRNVNKEFYYDFIFLFIR
jgi:hypothetical protein